MTLVMKMKMKMKIKDEERLGSAHAENAWYFILPFAVFVFFPLFVYCINHVLTIYTIDTTDTKHQMGR